MKSLAGRTIFILLIGLTFSHILSILVFTSEKLEGSVLTSKQQVLERMAAVVRLLLETPTSLHQSMVLAMNHNTLRFEVWHQPYAKEIWPTTDNDEDLRHQLETLIASNQVQVKAVATGEPNWNHTHGTIHRLLFAIEVAIIRLMHETVLDQELRALVALPNGQSVFLTTRPADNHVPLFRHATISVIIMTGAIFLFSLLIARHLTRPFARIVRAADAFGLDVYAAPLPETGADEIVTMARAFNRMNRRIREFVEERLRMIAAISHDLRTPLTQMKLMAEFVDNESTRERMIFILDEMEAMLASTLALAQDATFVEPKQRVNLSGLLSSICADLNDTGLLTTFDENQKKEPYLCRPLAMKRALTNLIHNAVKFGGCAHVSLLRMDSSWLVIVILDQGAGIPESEWENVFKPFLRLEPSRSTETGGVGLGLSIAASVIRDHGGMIRFSHPPDGGFAARVELPAEGQKGKNQCH
ncbi:MAG: HAMP domain-containing protein [Magnetococcales bacterium]|nr:HAMP domain-containing protein [Magnetococcales bacterium]